jgi:hypothetical protein
MIEANSAILSSGTSKVLSFMCAFLGFLKSVLNNFQYTTATEGSYTNVCKIETSFAKVCKLIRDFD